MGKRKDESPTAAAVGHKRARQTAEEPEDGARQTAEEQEYGAAEGRHSHACSDSNSNSQYSQASTGEVGIIENISLKNFMCHAMLGPFQFGPNVNFVVGNNGSGKSAVLTALIVGLGGKATATNRGSSLKGFVKHGQSSADVSVTLRNRGEDAFKPEVYGDSIIVQQHITQEGGRTYKLKSKMGHLVSSKKEELIAILDHFNIQVDNPVSVLTQEMSKHFLHSKNEGDKYKFFMKATQLEQMKEDYSYIMDTKARTHDQIKQGVERLEELKQHCLEKEKRFQSITCLTEMKDQLEILKHQMAWAVVNELEKQLNPVRDHLNVEESRTVKFDQKVEEWQGKVNEAEVKFKAVQDKLEKINEEAQALKPQCISLKSDVQATKRAYNEAEVLCNRHRTELKRLERDDQQLHMRIEELKKSVDQVSETEKLERLNKIATLKDELKMLHDQARTTAEQVDQFQQAIYKYKEEHSRLKREQRDVQSTLEHHKKHLRGLKESKTDRLKRFGENMPNLLEAIDMAFKQGRFIKKPVGPIGACIRLKDAQLALAVECCFKGLLHAFCCDNHKDERMLQLLMSKFFHPTKRPQIIVNEFRDEVYDVRQRAVFHPVYPSVLSALEIEDPVVANSLIDSRGIETILLIKNNQEARRVMQDQGPPKNCREAFTGVGDQVYVNRYYSSENNRPKYLSQDVEAEISVLEKEIENKTAQLSTFEQRLLSIENDTRQNEEFCRRHQQIIRQIQIKMQSIRMNIADLENVEEQQSVDISTLEDEAQENKNKMESVKNDLAQAKDNMDEWKRLVMVAEQKYNEIKIKISMVAEEADPVKDELNKLDREVDNCKRHKNHYEEKRREHLEKIQTRKEELTAKDRELKEKIEKARQIYPERIEVNRTARSLDTEINRLREKINSERDRHGNREEIIRQYQEAKENYQDIDSKVKNLKRFIKLLDEIMSQRYKTYQQFRRYLTVRCKFYFDTLLSQRAYSGKISFDHKNETLSITVQPGEGNKAALNDMRSLSGGERSFSTVCFVLSLWSIAESPFRCLDEFDVYMDMVNRRISMDMMLKMADSQRFRQFILLTPQNMSSLPSSSLIRILRMQDPERGQTALPFLPRGQGDKDENEYSS